MPTRWNNYPDVYNHTATVQQQYSNSAEISCAIRYCKNDIARGYQFLVASLTVFTTSFEQID